MRRQSITRGSSSELDPRRDVLWHTVSGTFHLLRLGSCPDERFKPHRQCFMLKHCNLLLRAVSSAPHEGVASVPGSIPPQRFGEKLRVLRQQNHLTQIELARELGLTSHAHITNIEAGRRSPSLELVLRVAGRFVITPDSLVDDQMSINQHAIVTSVPQFLQTNPLPLRFGEKLRLLRIQYGVTQTDLAYALGLTSHGHITNIETGRRIPSLELVLRTADHFHVTVESLVIDALPLVASEDSQESES